MSNGGSLHSNPPTSDIHITTHTTNWLWAVFAVMLLSDLCFIVWTFRLAVGRRVFHQIPIMILTTSTIAYFAMASDLGSTPVTVEWFRSGFTSSSYPTRAIWYVRYIQWAITTPLLLLELLLGTGLPLSDIVTVVFMGVVMVVCGLVGALTATSYKWGFYTLGCAALFYVLWYLFFNARRAAVGIGAEAGRAYRGSAFYLGTLWLLYPICWGLSEGGNVISPTGEMIFYGILDILTKPVFLAYHAHSLRRVPYEMYQLQSGKTSLGSRAHNGEKLTHNGHNNGTGVGNSSGAPVV